MGSFRVAAREGQRLAMTDTLTLPPGGMTDVAMWHVACGRNAKKVNADGLTVCDCV